MTVAADRTLDNNTDVNRKIPEAAIAPSALNGLVIEKIVGPGSGATVQLSQAAESIALVQAYTTATGLVPGVNPAFPIEGTDYDVVLEGAVSGVAELTEGAAAARTVETWVVHYVPKAADSTAGGASSVSP